MGARQSQPPAGAASAPGSSNGAALDGGCPVGFGAPREDACPAPQRWKNPKQFNVYAQEIDPRNQMPPPNLQPTPGQRIPLPTTRVQSTIPKGGTDSTWLYPSEQQFWNSLNRKGKAEGVKEEDVAMVIKIHNGMNERTWQEIGYWERRHQQCCDCENSTLLKFKGRPDQLSPKALIRKWLGGPEPFDRHDWIVDRCGKEVRYIIDYYYDENSPLPDDKAISFNDKGFLQTRRIWIDVRPAVDSFEAH
eukprot:tig00020531_g10055.t1